MDKLRVVMIGLVVLLLLFTASAFTVDQTEYALVNRFGKLRAIDQPGLYFKLPIIDKVVYYDNRILTLDTRDPAKFITNENKYMLVDSFVKWRIVDPIKYYETINVGGEAAAKNRLSQVVNAGLRAEFGVRTVRDVVAGERNQVMDSLRKKVDAAMRDDMGIEVVDVRLKRVDYDDAISKDVYKRMISERKRQANQLRSEGAAASEKIRADADKQREVIIAQAFRKAQEIKGQGDSRAAAIYNEAYSKSPEFYGFYRSVEAYKNSFKDKGDMMVLDRNSEFFKYMRQSQ